MTDTTSPLFKRRGTPAEIEGGLALMPHLAEGSLLAAVATDAATGEVLMLAWMNSEALQRTIETGEAHFWSRSRGRIWKKGEESGNVLRVIEMRTDCDQDAIWMRVEIAGHGAACHTGERSCFYRRIPLGRPVGDPHPLEPAGSGRAFDPSRIYGKGG